MYIFAVPARHTPYPSPQLDLPESSNPPFPEERLRRDESFRRSFFFAAVSANTSMEGLICILDTGLIDNDDLLTAIQQTLRSNRSEVAHFLSSCLREGADPADSLAFRCCISAALEFIVPPCNHSVVECLKNLLRLAGLSEEEIVTSINLTLQGRRTAISECLDTKRSFCFIS